MNFPATCLHLKIRGVVQMAYGMQQGWLAQTPHAGISNDMHVGGWKSRQQELPCIQLNLGGIYPKKMG